MAHAAPDWSSRCHRHLQAQDEAGDPVDPVAQVASAARAAGRAAGAAMVGVGQGKAREVPAAIAKASEAARRSMFDVPLIGTTIPHQVLGEASGAEVMLKPASPGTGVIAGGPVRAVVEAAGIKDLLSKSLGSSNAINIVHATIDGLRSLQRPEDVARRRGKTVEEVAPAYLLRPKAGTAHAIAAASAGAATN